MSIEAILGLSIQYGYWIVFVTLLLDNAGLPIPGELLLLIVGALVRNGDLSLGAGLLVASTAAVTGDSLGYWVGRLTGDRALHTYCRITLGSGICVRRAVGYYHHYGRATALVGRFVMGVRGFLSPFAGAAGMPFGRFLLLDSLGALLWAGVFVLVGYTFGWRLDVDQEGNREGSRLLLTVLGVGFGGYLLVKLLRRSRYGPACFRNRTVARVGSVLGLLPRTAFTANPFKTGSPTEEKAAQRPAGLAFPPGHGIPLNPWSSG